ncbi:MAG TPA: TauD/TfdA family dioxygenase [Frankiaceae bacterium]|jgi:taurine dioxygenase|nr:TauD/TfdA family dioxygenase [Frankiaceae bacterium]
MGLLTVDVPTREEIDEHGIDVRPVAGALGAELHGVDLRALDTPGVAAVKDLLHHYEVIFFPGADLTGDEQLALARQFGELNIFPVARLRGVTEPACTVITDGPDSPPEADDWHTDVTWIAEPPNYALLSAQVIPRRGGDTLWASMTAAHEALSPVMRGMIDDLEVVHDNSEFIRAMLRKMPAGPQAQSLADALREAFPPVTHPLVRTHPDTGRQALFVAGGFMRYIRGMREPESDNLLAFLRQHIENAALQCRWRWSPGDLAIWDERSTNHRSAADHFPQERSIRRVEVSGDRPYHRSAVQ